MQDKFPNLKGTIFIVTYGRSGSTLLQSLLQSIPGAHIVGENYNILESLFRAGQRARRMHQDWGKKDRPKDHPWYNADKVRPKHLEQRLVDVFIEEVLQPPPDVRWIGFKEVRISRVGDKAIIPFLNFHRNNFRNAFFVFNSRNAQDVAKSGWWKDHPTGEVVQMVENMDAHFTAFTAANPDCSYHVFYEQMVQDPTSLQPLFDKLGEPFDPEAARAKLETRLTH